MWRTARKGQEHGAECKGAEAKPQSHRRKAQQLHDGQETMGREESGMQHAHAEARARTLLEGVHEARGGHPRGAPASGGGARSLRARVRGSSREGVQCQAPRHASRRLAPRAPKRRGAGARRGWGGRHPLAGRGSGGRVCSGERRTPGSVGAAGGGARPPGGVCAKLLESVLGVRRRVCSLAEASRPPQRGARRSWVAHNLHRLRDAVSLSGRSAHACACCHRGTRTRWRHERAMWPDK